MKKLNLTCPNCKSNNAREWSKGEIRIFDDEINEFFKKEFNAPDSDVENHYVAKCICDDCQNHFEVKVIIDVQVKEIKEI